MSKHDISDNGCLALVFIGLIVLAVAIILSGNLERVLQSIEK